MTRLRAVGSIPTPLMAEYYGQRASAGLIITECTMISPLSNGYVNCPGIYSPEQITAWQRVTDGVHRRGGKIFLQLWHSGRIGHPSLLNGALPIAPSAIPAIGTLHGPAGKVTLATPRALETDEISEIVKQFRQGAENARQAGFDGVELHGAFGYLIDQFLQDGSNQRTDHYGGSIENRVRFLLEVVEAVCQVWGGDRVGIKLSPSNTLHGMQDSDPLTTFSYALEKLNAFKLAYVHLMEPSEEDLNARGVINPVISTFGPFYRGLIITNGGYDKLKGNQILETGKSDLVSFGKPFIANPDLPERFIVDGPLNELDFTTVYGKAGQNLEQGYTDYPSLKPAEN
ncbi:NADH:flavin oxidoreductase, Old Yellow Enzyme family [Synechocystis sp. PCC 6714]|nr:NADH:flavin oxidoreductase, Old Yellow Enzyme family [Synechocystis sp. PCC 6714]